MAKYYIYTHRRTDKNQVFYVGMAAKVYGEDDYYRAYNIRQRNPIWKKIFKKTNYCIDIRIIEENDSLEYICSKERELIKQYGKICEETGYLSNIGDGGEHTVRKARKVIQYDLNGNFVSEFNNAMEAALVFKIHYKSIYLCCINRNLSSHGYMWKYWTPNFSRKIDSYHFRDEKTIIQYDKNLNILGYYPTANEASRKTNIDSASIKKVCYGNRKLAGGYIWRYLKDNDPIILENYKNWIRIEQYDLNDNFIKGFRCISDAMKELKINSNTAIRNCFAGKQKQAYGYKWKRIN